MDLLKVFKKKQIKLFLKIKQKNFVNCRKLQSKIFYNLNYIYIKNNFLLINKLIKYNTFSNIIFKKNYILNDSFVYNDLFILNYLDNNFNNKAKTMIHVNKTKKPLSIILILKKIIFSNKKFFRLLKNEKKFLKLNIYNIYFFLFYYYMINSLSYISFLKFNNLKKKKTLFTLNLFLKKNLKRSFKFFFKNIIMFLYKYSLIKNKKNKLFKSVIKKRSKIFKKKTIIFSGLKKIKYLKRKAKIFSFIKRKSKKQRKIANQKRHLYRQKRRLLHKQLKKEKKQKKNVFFNKNIYIKLKKKRNLRKIQFNLTLKYRRYSTKNNKLIKQKKRINKQQLLYYQLKRDYKLKKEQKIFKKLKKFIKKKFKNLFKKKKKKLSFFKKLFFKKRLVKRMSELYFKKDIKLKNATEILKNNKKFKFLTFPINSICKFFFKNSMYNIFMTLVVLPINLTIGNYSGGHFNILSKRRDRGSINSLKSMAKLISLKIYQSNLSFIIFCPRLFTNNNKRLIKTIFYSFKILNRSPITKIYLYRPVIRNGIRSKKLPRK